MKDKILAMKADRKLDNMIAIEVFNNGTYAFSESGELWTTEFKLAPHYSSDISAAWSVLQEFEEVEVRRYVSAGNDYMYECSITIKGVTVSKIEKSAPLAICKAALLVVMS